MRIENGYEIRGNLAKVGRHYQVCDAAGKSHADIRGSVELAIAKAQSLPAGDIKPPPVEVKPPEQKPEAKPRLKVKSPDEGK